MSNQNYGPIFAENARKYWESGLVAIPLHIAQKRPIENAWSQHGYMFPTPELQAEWIAKYPHGNIGVAAGVASNIAFIDVDSADPRITEIIYRLIPVRPWLRHGKKGFQIAVKFNPKIRAFKASTKETGTLVEYLSQGNQSVMAPSIHPETLQPYTCNVPLYAVVKELPMLPDDFEDKVKAELQYIGYDVNKRNITKLSEYTPLGARDNRMTAIAGIYANDILKGKVTLQQAILQLHEWYKSLVEKVEGDELDIEKGEQKILQFLRADMDRTNRPLPSGWDVDLAPEYKKQLDDLFKPEDQEIGFQQIKDEYMAKLAKTPVNDVVIRGNLVDETLQKMARNKNALTDLETSSLVRFIKSTCGIDGVTDSSLRKVLRTFTEGDLAGTDHTQIAKAVITDLSRFGEIRYFQTLFWQWRGSHWETLPDSDLLKHVAENYGHCPAARRNSDHGGILKVMGSLSAKALRTVNVNGVNFGNGFLTDKMELKDHHPDFGATYTLPYCYKPENAGNCPKFMNFLVSSWKGDSDLQQKIEGLQEAIATTMFGVAPIYQRAFLLYGVASSGKSTLLQILSGLLPDGVQCSVNPDCWQDRFLPTEMNHKLLNICGELSESQSISGKDFKSIIDAMPLNGQFKGKPIFKFKPMCAHWFGSNHLPRTKDTSEGFNRRWLIFRFSHPVPDQDRDRYLAQRILEEEREAIVSWAMQAYPRMLQGVEDYTLSESHIEIVSQMANTNNSIRFFLTGSTRLVLWKNLELAQQEKESHASYRMSEDQLFTEYRAFCSDMGIAGAAGLGDLRKRMTELLQIFKLEMRTEKRLGRLETLYYGITLAKAKATK